MAVAIEWDRYVDTDVLWSEFFASNHTMVVRFMPAHTYTYNGYLLSSTVGDLFAFGIGEYPGIGAVRVNLPNVRLKVAGQSILYESGSAMSSARTFADFDSGSYDGWQATGTCFGNAPATGTFPNQDPVLDFQGRGLVNTYLNGSSNSTGTLTSPVFTVERPYIRFLIGGGRLPDRCALQLLQGGQVVRTETGRESTRLQWMCWDVRPFLGQQMTLRIVDQDTGSGGYILVDQIEFSDAPLLQTGIWQELALVRAPHPLRSQDLLYWPYLNGELLGAPVSLPPGFVPPGALRIGAQIDDPRHSQFHGLIDEVAVYRTALSRQELRARVFAPTRLTGAETDLLAGWTFTEGAQPRNLDRPLTGSVSIAFVTTSPGTDSDGDVRLLSLPSQNAPAVLPFPVGEEWTVIQEFDERHGSHAHAASFCWDFSRATGSTNGAAVYVSAAGSVAFILDGRQDDDNRVEIRIAPNELHAYIHTRNQSAAVTQGAPVSKGSQVAVIGLKNHLHFAAEDKLDGTRVNGDFVFVTRPLAFYNYERREPNGFWTSVPIGMPRAGEVIRRAPNTVVATLQPASPPFARRTSIMVTTIEADTGSVVNGSVTLNNYRSGLSVQQTFPTNQPAAVILRVKSVRVPPGAPPEILFPWLEVNVPGFAMVRIDFS